MPADPQAEIKPTRMPELTEPLMVAVWPGMGHVALTAGYYLMAKLQMTQMAEFHPLDLFDVHHIDVEHGMIRQASLPRSRFYYWKDPSGRRDLVVFIGEAQPPLGHYAFCHRLLEFAEQVGVKRVFTFAAMGTRMKLGETGKTFGMATDPAGFDEMKRLEVEPLEEGRISGLNGVLLAVAAERGMRGMGLLGEMPYFAAQILFPRASHAVLEAFTPIANLDLDLTELSDQARAMEQQIIEAIRHARQQQQHQQEQQGEADPGRGEPAFGDTPPQLPGNPPASEAQSNRPALSDENRARIEELFEQARQDRSRAYELKAELDRLGVFEQYEDRFLDLFKPS